MESQINGRECNKKCILGDWVATKWKNLMDQFRSILNKKKSGSGGDSIEDATDKWKFYDRMSFLKEFISNRQ